MSAPIEVVIRWIEEDAFEIVEPPQAGKALDGNRKIGLSPMETLLASLAGCMGIDVVMILLKMRSQLETLQIGVRGHRNDDPPRYFNRLELEFQLRGVLTEKQAHRAIDLSFEKYCSVFHTLRDDIQIERRVILN